MIGASLDRVEYHRLLTGHAEYTDDIDVPGAGHLAVLRSQYAHVRIDRIDTTVAEALDGVDAVLTLADMQESDVPTPNRFLIIPGPGISTPNISTDPWSSERLFATRANRSRSS